MNQPVPGWSATLTLPDCGRVARHSTGIGSLDQVAEAQGRNVRCWRHRNSRSRDQCYLPYGCRCLARRGDRADERNAQERETETRVFDIADGRA